MDQVQLEELPRMADFAKWATAAETGWGMEPGTFIKAYAGNQESANELTLEASPVAGPLRELLEAGEWKGTATELLVVLDRRVTESTKRLKSWPKDGRALSNALRRLATNLRESGISVEFKESDRVGKKVQRTINLAKVGDASATAATPGNGLSYDVAGNHDVAAKIPPYSNQADHDEEVF